MPPCVAELQSARCEKCLHRLVPLGLGPVLVLQALLPQVHSGQSEPRRYEIAGLRKCDPPLRFHLDRFACRDEKIVAGESKTTLPPSGLYVWSPERAGLARV
jgi:hypothetical protein